MALQAGVGACFREQRAATSIHARHVVRGPLQARSVHVVAHHARGRAGRVGTSAAALGHRVLQHAGGFAGWPAGRQAGRTCAGDSTEQEKRHNRGRPTLQPLKEYGERASCLHPSRCTHTQPLRGTLTGELVLGNPNPVLSGLCSSARSFTLGSGTANPRGPR